jgi:hypothetical protein
LGEFQRTLQGSVELPTIEPTLKIKFVARQSNTGHLDCEIDFTRDHMSERHHFVFDMDQSYLPGLLSQLATVLRDYLIRGAK